MDYTAQAVRTIYLDLNLMEMSFLSPQAIANITPGGGDL